MAFILEGQVAVLPAGNRTSQDVWQTIDFTVLQFVQQGLAAFTFSDFNRPGFGAISDDIGIDRPAVAKQLVIICRQADINRLHIHLDTIEVAHAYLQADLVILMAEFSHAYHW